MQQIKYVLFLLWFTAHIGQCNDVEPAGIHFPLFRRSGRLSLHQLSNVTELSDTLSQVEARYARTSTKAEQNKIVRRWQTGPKGVDDYLLNATGFDGTWFVVEHDHFESTNLLMPYQGTQ